MEILIYIIGFHFSKLQSFEKLIYPHYTFDLNLNFTNYHRLRLQFIQLTIELNTNFSTTNTINNLFILK